ncbi:MAG: phosphonate ABC transporter substrate-binding protein [Pikeienuella sp.]
MRTLIAAAAATLVATAAIAEDTKGLGIEEFRVGILGGENEADRIKNNVCLQERFEALLGVPVKLFPAADYAGVIEGLLGGNLDYAYLGSSSYAAVHIEDPEAVTPVLTRRQLDGATGYYSVLVTRADSGIEAIEDMEGKRLGYADPNSTSGYLIPSVEFDQMGIDAGEFFSETTFSGGHEQNVLAVLNGDVDGGVTWTSHVGEYEEGFTSGNLRKMVDKGLLDMNDIQIIWRSKEITNGPVVLRNDLPEQVRLAVKGSLLTMPLDDSECFNSAFGGEYIGFVEIDHDFYSVVLEARRRVIEQ